jgi:hypothetical protein
MMLKHTGQIYLIYEMVQFSRHSDGLDGRGSISERRKIFLFSTTTTPALMPTRHPIQWVPGATRPGIEADHSPPSSDKVKNDGSIPPLPHMP